MKDYPKASDFKGQKQPYPAKQSEMDPVPDVSFSNYKPAGKLMAKPPLSPVPIRVSGVPSPSHLP